MAVAADLEGTLTSAQSWRALGGWLRDHRRGSAYQLAFLRRLPEGVAARLGAGSLERFQERWMLDLARLFHGIHVETFEQVAADVVDGWLWPQRRPEVVAALRVHLAAGERVVIASGAFQPIVDAFAARLADAAGGADIGALGTGLSAVHGRLDGALDGPLNVGEAKARALHELLGPERLYAAYGDSLADVPMLLLSDRPVAVYPGRALRRTAADLGWTVFDP